MSTVEPGNEVRADDIGGEEATKVRPLGGAQEGGASGRRSYDNSLRQRQQELTRASILDAAKELVLEGRLHNFSVQEVASRAGVSHRTVYVHFPSREAILEGLVEWGVQKTADVVPPFPERLDDLAHWAERCVPALMPYLPLAKAMDAVVQTVYDRQIPSQSRKRDEQFSALIEEVAPGLTRKELKVATAGLRLWVSMRTLVELHFRYGLDESELLATVRRGIRAQIEEIKRDAAAEKGRAE